MSRNGKAPAILKGSHRFWVPCLHRWLVPRELAVCHGFPVTGALMGIEHLIVCFLHF